ncbi:hypothetical protein SAMN05421736_101868 [Evansella caseinilytica]|uniref:Outer membrane lipoprotein-sorting protein n=1 Tax=Evansella caseinilytica TaxID=1503961 RepID=A0A1H3INB6_9BACI|nr:hypothetical protein [Evansella caseinilytica]SDY28779.1 hypothetical protein SAMN05421736_101868 [Evansella caseinilytica]
MNKIINGLLPIIGILGITAGCSSQITASADEIVENVLTSGKDTEAYYAEGEMHFYHDDEVLESYQFQEYIASDGSRKTTMIDLIGDNETITVRKDNELISYDQESGTAYTLDQTAMDLPHSLTQREQLAMILEAVKGTHQQEIAGEETISGIETYHIVLKADSPNSILGDMELWVDPKTWFTMKAVSVSGDVRSEVFYTSVDFSPDFSEATFALELPDDVKLESLDKLNQPQEGTIADAEKALGTAFYVLDNEQAVINNIELHSYSGWLEREEVVINYLIDGAPGFSLSIFPTPEEFAAEFEEHERSVRGLPAEYDTIQNTHFLLWDEDGLRYSIVSENPALTLDDILALTENMSLSTKE